MTTFGTVVDWTTMQVVVPDGPGAHCPAPPGTGLMVPDHDTLVFLGHVFTADQGSWRAHYPDHVRRISVSADGWSWVGPLEGIPDESVGRRPGP